MAVVSPYLNFQRTCEEAFNFYKSVFGGEFVGGGIMRFGSMPPEHCKPGDENLVMHVALAIPGGSIIMGSDFPDSFGQFKKGNDFSIAIAAESEAEAKKLFGALSEGGAVDMPLDKAPWGALFGMCKDKYGIAWGVNYQYEPIPQQN